MRAGIYLHIPFCEHKCGYCDFYSATDIDQLGSGFINALIEEIKQTKSTWEFDTIFFGGGTPSLLKSKQLALILDQLDQSFSINKNSEITIETNPGTVDREKLADFKSIGINRISFGVQSFHEDELKFMERIHSPQQAIEAVNNASAAGFTNISLDLMFALPNQTINRWKETIKRVESLPIQHISAYNLIIEENTPFATLEKNGVFKSAEQEIEREFYQLTIDRFSEMGFNQYEISNFSRTESFQSQHNLKYWKMAPYIGFGPSAHSYNGVDKRWWNVRSTQKYIEMITKNRSAKIKDELLDLDQQLLETLMQSFRLRNGLDIIEFKNRFKINFTEHYANSIDRFKRQGLLDITNNHCYLTNEGQFYCNEILRNF